MQKLMVTIQSHVGAPTLEEIRQRYGLAPDDLDSGYGVVEIDPDDGTYVILANPEAAAKILGAPGTASWRIHGPYSNPRIEPFGPPTKGEDPPPTNSNPT